MKKILTYYLRPFYPRMFVGFIIKFIGTVMDLGLPWILAYMIDVVIPQKDKGQIYVWGIAMLLCAAIGVTSSVAANRMASKVASEAIEVIRSDLFQKVICLSAGQTDQIGKPSLISRLTSDTYNIHNMIGRIQRLGVRAPILLIGGIAVTMTLDPVLSSILLVDLFLLGFFIFFISKRSIPMYDTLQKSVDAFVRIVREDIAGIRVIKSLSKDVFEERKFDKINQEVVEREKQAGIAMAAVSPVSNIFLNLGLVIVIIAGAYRIAAGLTEVGKILAFLSYFTVILNAMISISRMVTIYSKAAASADRIAEILDKEQELTVWNQSSSTDTGIHKETNIHIEFRDVSFSYSKVKNDLNHISFQLKQGETLGIIGETGSGKTTIINLLMRFYDIDSGSIWINGQDIRTMELKQLRKRFGVVFQNDTIFEDTISGNVGLGRDLSSKKIQDALFYAQASEFTKEKGGQSGASLNIKGANLSGGQKQRVLIARALASKPEILILDDSSSALDYKTDAVLRSKLKEHFQATTTIMIAQRISSIMNANHIMVLEEGNVIGYGTHHQLIQSCKIYQEISHSQMGVN